MGCTLNIGTVPMGCTQNIGTVTMYNLLLKIITKILYGLQFYKDAVTIECVSMESLEFLFLKDNDFNPTNKEFGKVFVKFESPRRFLERLIVQKIFGS